MPGQFSRARLAARGQFALGCTHLRFISADLLFLRTCIHSRGKLEGRGFFPPDKEIFRSSPDRLQGNPTSMMEKMHRQRSMVVNTGS